MSREPPTGRGLHTASHHHPIHHTQYVPRRSNRVNPGYAVSDGDVWQERLAVCEGGGALTADGNSPPAPRLLIRSYFRNGRTHQRVWDEPPTGASQILHATAEMRKMANAQLKELQQTLDLIPPEDQQQQSQESGGGGDRSGKGMMGVLSRFRGKKKKNSNKKATAAFIDESKDLNLQRAIARSMLDQRRKSHHHHNRGSEGGGGRGGGDGSSSEPVVYYDTDDGAMPLSDEEALAVAKALSISECSAPFSAASGVTAGDRRGSKQQQKEEEMLRCALEESRREALLAGVSGVADLPEHLDHHFDEHQHQQPQQPHPYHGRDYHHDDGPYQYHQEDALLLAQHDDAAAVAPSMSCTTPPSSFSTISTAGPSTPTPGPATTGAVGPQTIVADSNGGERTPSLSSLDRKMPAARKVEATAMSTAETPPCSAGNLSAIDIFDPYSPTGDAAAEAAPSSLSSAATSLSSCSLKADSALALTPCAKAVASGSSSSSSNPASSTSTASSSSKCGNDDNEDDSSPLVKMDESSNEDRRKPGRSITRRVFGGSSRHVQDQAGVV